MNPAPPVTSIVLFNNTRYYCYRFAELLTGKDQWHQAKNIWITFSNSFLVKAVDASTRMMPDAELQLPYEGAKKMLLVDNVEDKDFLCRLFDSMYDELPAPKTKNK